MNKQKLLDELAKLASCLEDFKGITGYCDGKYAAYEIAIELAKQLDEPQAEKVEVPDFVAEWFESRYHINQDIYNLLFKGNMLNDNSLTKFEKWFYSDPINNFETLIRMKDGYTVKPKRWVVKSAGDYLKDLKLDAVQEIAHRYAVSTEIAIKFTDKSKAEAVATLVDGSVEEV